jgi:hypothetical protein
VRRTKEGMIAKGLKFGRKPKYGPQHIAKFRDLVENQGVRPLAALKQLGISTPYYYAYKDAIFAWKEGDPWPPPGGFPSKDNKQPTDGADVIPLHGRAG